MKTAAPQFRLVVAATIGAFALFGVVARARAEIGYVRSFTGVSASANSVSVTTTAATTHGDLLIAIVSVSSSSLVSPSTLPTPATETGYNSTWTLVTSSSQNSGTRCSIFMYYIENAAAQPTGTVQQWTLNGTATAAAVSISEYRGAKTSGSLRTSNSLSSGAGSTSTQGTNPASSQSADVDGMYVGAVTKASNVTWTSATNGFGLRSDSAAISGTLLSSIVVDKQVTAAASTSSTVSYSQATLVVGSGAIAVFTPAPVTAKYWIGNGSNTDCAAAANWSTWSGGSTYNVAPTSTMDVFFDGNGTGSCTLSAVTTWNSLTIGTAYSGTITVSANLTLSSATTVATVGGGTLAAGAATLTFKGGLTVSSGGTLNLTSTGTAAIGNGKSLIADGTLRATSGTPTIQVDTSGSYTFKVGSSSGATPALNITTLKVKNTDTNGMWINANTGASTTITSFNNLAFSSGTSGGSLLQIYATSLNLVSNGCTFDASTTYTVKLTGDGFTAGSESTQTRAVFGGATCSAGSCQSTKSDDDSNNDGVPTAASGGAVVQFVSNAPTDTAGTIDGFPTAAFSWNDGSYYATYVAFHNTSSDTVYVRDGAGAAKYSWSTSSAETIVGSPRWTTEGSSGSEKHYLYVALSDGKVYRLLDNGSSLAPDTASTGWSSANPYNCSCTITTPIALDSTNVYWAGQKTSDSSYRIWAVGQADQSVPGWSPMRPSAVSSPTTTETAVTAASLATWSSGGSTYVFVGQTGYIVKANVTTGTVAEYNSNPGSGKSILGRIIVAAGSGTHRVLAGDDGGNFWSIAPGTFSGTSLQWNYNALAGTDQIKSSPVYDYTNVYVHFGTEGGRLVVLNASTGAALTGYPMTSLTTDPMRTAILYRSGVVAVGTTTGKLFFVNRRTTTSGTLQLMREYYFGSTEQVSGIAYDSNASKYLVTTSSSSANDGRLFTIDATDSTLIDTDGIL